MKKKIASALALCAMAAVIIYVYTSRVENKLTSADRAVLGAVCRRFRIPPFAQNSSYESEIAIIAAAQKAVLRLAPGNTGIPEGACREPADLFARGTGLCYDRSRSLEKLLRFLGFTTRHVFTYAAPETGREFLEFFRRDADTHAVSEVLTKKGWLLLESNGPWMAVTSSGEPVSAAAMKADAGKGEIAWKDPAGLNYLFKKRFGYVYGLYSRHGRFYPPYNVVPDINWNEFAQNL